MKVKINHNLNGLNKFELKRIVRNLEKRINNLNIVDFVEFIGELSNRRANLIILKKDHFKCRLCNSPEDIQVHHITPKSIGGKNTFDNLVTLCSKCHHFIHYCNPMIKFGEVGNSHRQLTKNGLENARAQGKQIGRPKNK
jgi:hypothetical protein